ncbi:hypothetical protein [Sinorhizobium meliloti]|uniref:hypothetical protein n=1 Tax=Rhizobium meliloti TaxID=382 RepID=UPI001F260429|nr:hypothetical protein [Sinorhizobium meliloti]
MPGYWFPKEVPDADSFAFELLHNQNHEEQRFPRKIGADAWFDKASAARYEITEQSFRIPGEGVVTILNLDPRMVE